MATTKHSGDPRLPAITTILLLLLSLPATTISSPAAPPPPPPIPKGFRLELIHRDSPRSPFYIANLTPTQRLQRDLGLNHNLASGDDGSIIRPYINYKPFLYMVNVTLPPGNQTYLLGLDTGSSTVWTQCHPCNGCPRQHHPPFDISMSRTYQLLPCSNKLCNQPPFDCVDEDCHYTLSYDNGASAQGLFSRDYFMFQGLVIPVTFGCTYKVTGWTAVGEYPEGVFGMSQAPLSFASQIYAFSGVSRFSYCLPPPEASTESFLRFGDDIGLHWPVQRIPFSDTDIHGLYYLDLVDISLDDELLILPSNTFARRVDGNGGFFVNSASSLSMLVAPAYDRVMSVLVAYFNFFRLQRTDGPLELCYKIWVGFSEDLPSMTLHFRGADLGLGPENLFVRIGGMFCWAMVRNDVHSVLGAYQQRNVRFVFDLDNREVQFMKEDCAVTR